MSDNSTQFKKGQTPWNKIGTLKVCELCSIEYPVRGIRRRAHSRFCSKVCQGKYQSTQPSPNAGKRMSQEARYKMRQAKLGIRGEAHPLWRPWTKQSHRDRIFFRNTMQKKIFERDSWKCVLCSEKKDLQVDHIKRWADYPELRFVEDNCRTLCAKCHYRITFGRDMPKSVRAWGHNLAQRVAS